LCTYRYDDFRDSNRKKLNEVYAKSANGINIAPVNRTKALRLLEEDFELSPGSLVMYSEVLE
jgi:hypothetical protein